MRMKRSGRRHIAHADVGYLETGILHGINYNSENFRNFVEYMGMLQKVLTLVQQLEDNDRKGEKNN